MTEGPGFVVRQATEVLMDQQVAMDLNGIMMAHQLEDQQNRLKSGINEIAAEVIRVTSVMGTAVSHLAEKAHESDHMVIEELKAWTAELERGCARH